MARRRQRNDSLPFPGDDEPRVERVRRGSRIGQGLQAVLAFVLTFAAALACAVFYVIPAVSPAQPAAAQGEAGADSEAPLSPDYALPTAREAYVPALELARETDPAAELMSAAALWTPQFDAAQLVMGRGGWTFFFYLPASAGMMTVTVGQEREAEVTGVEPWASPPQLFEDARWNADSPQIAGPLVERCSTALEESVDAQAELRLSTAEANRSLLWYGRVQPAGGGEPLCEISVDAVTGVVR